MNRQRRHSRAGSDRPPPYMPYDSNGLGHNQGRGFESRSNVTPQGRGERQHFFNLNVNYGSVPHDPQVPQVHTTKAHTPRMLKMLFASLICSWLVFFVFGYCANVPFNSALHERRRRLWDEEENYRAITRQAWAVEVRKHQELQLRMQKERVAFDEMRREWAREREAEREERERRKRQAEEDEARKRASISWEGLAAGHCVRYGVKEYTATLSRVPLGLDSIQECQRKSINIHGRDWSPSRCEESGFCGRVTAHWEVDIDESTCKPWWVNYRDKGCVENGIRRHEASIENLWDTENWENICMTTPINIGGRYYDGPTSCANWLGHTTLHVVFLRLITIQIIWSNLTRAEINYLRVDECVELLARACQLSYLEIGNVLPSDEAGFPIPSTPVLHNQLRVLKMESMKVDEDPLSTFICSVAFPGLQYLSICLADQLTDTLLDFFRRSACLLTELCIENTEPDNEDDADSILLILKSLPSLKRLDFRPASFNPDNLFRRLAQTAIPTDDVSTERFLPNLESLHYLVGDTIFWDMLADIFGPTSELRNARRRPLNHVCVDFEFDMYANISDDYMDTDELYRFSLILDQGLNVDISYPDPDSDTDAMLDIHEFMRRSERYQRDIIDGTGVSDN